MDDSNQLHGDHLPEVMACFLKLSQLLKQDSQICLSAEPARSILQAGPCSPSPEVRQGAEEARENLLRLGRFDFLDSAPPDRENPM